MEKNKNKNKNSIYLLTKNNYVGLLFFALVLASLLYIIKHETATYTELEPTTKAIVSNEKDPITITEETNEIATLRKYLNQGDPNTFKIYQSMYIYDSEINIDYLSEETMLYIAYKYLENNSTTTNNLQYITCAEAESINISNTIIQCGGTKYNTSYYMVNHNITKELLKDTVLQIFNVNIKNYTNFYTKENNLCYYINNDYLCITHNSNNNNQIRTETEFIKAIKYDSKIEIIENYRYINKDIYYKGFGSNEIGEQKYISTFTKTNGAYHWESTKPYQEN